MFCLFCKEEIADGAIKCKHCQSMLNDMHQNEDNINNKSILCQFCKEEIAEGAIKCKHCQSMLNDTQQTGLNNTNKLIKCPFCKEEIANDLIKCKHCQSMLNISNQIYKENISIEDKINKLNVSETIKYIFRLINNANFTKTILGIPIFNPKIKPGIFCWPVLFFSVFYYLYRNMWKKAVVLFGIYMIGVFMLISFGLPDVVIFIFAQATCIYMGKMAYYDYYRKEILNEDFWW